MIRKSANGIEWLEFELLANEPELVHGVFLRHGGVSEGAYASLNAGGRRGDEVSKVEENRRRVKQALDASTSVAIDQVHGNSVKVVTEADGKMGEADALITKLTDVGLMIMHADCQVAVIYDPIHHCVANVHCGWRGNVKNIYQAAIQRMVDVFGSKPADLLVGISPSLGPNHSEFVNYRIEFPEEFWEFQVRPEYFDLWAITETQLKECGILPHHLEMARICTFSNPQDFFSYRRDRVTGNHATLAKLRACL